MSARDKLTEGTTFRNFTDLEETLQELQRTENVLFVINDSRKTKVPALLESHRYEYVQFGCKEGKGRKPRGTGARPYQRSLKHNCSAALRCTLKEVKGDWVLQVTKSKLDHDTHTPSTEMMADYPENRKIQLSDGVKAVLADPSVSVKEIKQTIEKQQGIAPSVKDIHNLRAAARKHQKRKNPSAASVEEEEEKHVRKKRLEDQLSSPPLDPSDPPQASITTSSTGNFSTTTNMPDRSADVQVLSNKNVFYMSGLENEEFGDRGSQLFESELVEDLSTRRSCAQTEIDVSSRASDFFFHQSVTNQQPSHCDNQICPPTDITPHISNNLPQQRISSDNLPHQSSSISDCLPNQLTSFNSIPKQTRSFVNLPDQFQSSDNLPQQAHSSDNLSQMFHSSDNLSQMFHSSDNLPQQVPFSDNLSQQVPSSDNLSQQFHSSDNLPQQLLSSDNQANQFHPYYNLPNQFSSSGNRPNKLPSSDNLPQQSPSSYNPAQPLPSRDNQPHLPAPKVISTTKQPSDTPVDTFPTLPDNSPPLSRYLCSRLSSYDRFILPNCVLYSPEHRTNLASLERRAHSRVPFHSKTRQEQQMIVLRGFVKEHISLDHGIDFVSLILKAGFEFLQEPDPFMLLFSLKGKFTHQAWEWVLYLLNYSCHYCPSCQKLVDHECPSVQCKSCLHWVHRDCAGIRSSTGDEPFFCRRCQNDPVCQSDDDPGVASYFDSLEFTANLARHERTAYAPVVFDNKTPEEQQVITLRACLVKDTCLEFAIEDNSIRPYSSLGSILIDKPSKLSSLQGKFTRSAWLFLNYSLYMKNKESPHTCPSCDTLLLDELSMVQCESCRERFHSSCVTVDPSLEVNPWFCPDCRHIPSSTSSERFSPPPTAISPLFAGSSDNSSDLLCALESIESANYWERLQKRAYAPIPFDQKELEEQQMILICACGVCFHWVGMKIHLNDVRKDRNQWSILPDKASMLSSLKDKFTQEAWGYIQHIINLPVEVLVDKCPNCRNEIDRVCTVVRCQSCLRQFHYRCVDIGLSVDVNNWFCRECHLDGWVFSYHSSDLDFVFLQTAKCRTLIYNMNEKACDRVPFNSKTNEERQFILLHACVDDYKHLEHAIDADCLSSLTSLGSIVVDKASMFSSLKGKFTLKAWQLLQTKIACKVSLALETCPGCDKDIDKLNTVVQCQSCLQRFHHECMTTRSYHNPSFCNECQRDPPSYRYRNLFERHVDLFFQSVEYRPDVISLERKAYAPIPFDNKTREEQQIILLRGIVGKNTSLQHAIDSDSLTNPVPLGHVLMDRILKVPFLGGKFTSRAWQILMDSIYFSIKRSVYFCTFCHTPVSDERNMLRCDSCLQRFHSGCVDVGPRKPSEVDHWFCPQCRLGPSTSTEGFPPPTRDIPANVSTNSSSDSNSASSFHSVVNLAHLASFERTAYAPVRFENKEREEQLVIILHACVEQGTDLTQRKIEFQSVKKIMFLGYVLESEADKLSSLKDNFTPLAWECLQTRIELMEEILKYDNGVLWTCSSCHYIVRQLSYRTCQSCKVLFHVECWKGVRHRNRKDDSLKDNNEDDDSEDDDNEDDDFNYYWFCPQCRR